MGETKSIVDQLADAEATVEHLKLQILQGTCVETGHQWVSNGGKNAGCATMGDCCSCSVPVHVCEKCGDSDYGDNESASVTRDRCQRGLE